jgi:hemerythrin superfamily protein
MHWQCHNIVRSSPGTSFMDATVFLQVDHDELKARLREMTDASATPSARMAAFRALRRALGLHTYVEEEIFYPAVMKVRSPAAREAVRSALEDHHVVEGLMAELAERDDDDPQFAARAARLRVALEAHLAEEEESLFAEARMHLTDERLERLGRRMEALQTALRVGSPGERQPVV